MQNTLDRVNLLLELAVPLCIPAGMRLHKSSHDSHSRAYRIFDAKGEPTTKIGLTMWVGQDKDFPIHSMEFDDSEDPTEIVKKISLFAISLTPQI